MKTLESLHEVNGGGAELKTYWKDALASDMTLEQVRKVGEGTVKNCYGAAIRKRIGKLEEVHTSVP